MSRNCVLQTLLVITILAALLCTHPTGAQSLDTAFEPAIENAQQRVVKIFGAGAGNVESYSTGIIVSSDGKILTRHGVFLEGNQIRVIMPDGQTHEAVVLRRQREIKVALLQIVAETPNYFELSDEPVGEIGDWVMAVSNAFKVAHQDERLSTTLGVYSLRSAMRVERNKRDVAYDGDAILIDCITSNPGAAGGAVIGADGTLVGMIGTIFESDETKTRTNYAVPVDLLASFLADRPLRPEVADNTGDNAVKKDFDLGIRLFKLGGSRGAAYIDRVIPGSPADEIGLQPDDLIISLDGVKINTVRDFKKALGTIESDNEIVIVFKRDRDLIRVPITPVEK